jgi:DNA-binding transcriptional MerR regulator
MEIRELAARTGTTSKTIRYYESIYLLPEANQKANYK